MVVKIVKTGIHSRTHILIFHYPEHQISDKHALEKHVQLHGGFTEKESQEIPQSPHLVIFLQQLQHQTLIVLSELVNFRRFLDQRGKHPTAIPQESGICLLFADIRKKTLQIWITTAFPLLSLLNQQTVGSSLGQHFCNSGGIQVALPLVAQQHVLRNRHVVHALLEIFRILGHYCIEDKGFGCLEQFNQSRHLSNQSYSRKFKIKRKHPQLHHFCKFLFKCSFLIWSVLFRLILFIDQTYLLMLGILASYLKLSHIALIGYICQQICTPIPRLPYEVFFVELGLTLINILVSKRHFLDVFQIVLSLNLTYSLIPNNYSFIAGLYFLKIIFVHNSFGEAIETLLETANNSLTRILKFLLTILRYTLVEFLFLGVVMLAYKVFTLGDTEGTLPEDYITLYQLIVTATTIGYGDITPKSKIQIQFFTYAIPFVCASFVLYFNAVIPVLGQLTDFLTGNASLQTDEGCREGEVLRSKVWSGAERDSFVNFIEEVTKRQAEHEEHNKRLGHNWIAVSANHYERQIPLISTILAGDEGKELKLKVSSKVRRQYYPKGWVILQAGDISEDLMMVDEGEVKSPAAQKKGFVFNREGFSSKSPSRETIVATELVSIWAISMRDLEELAKNSSKIQAILTEGLKI